MRRLALLLWSFEVAAIALTVVVGLQSGEDLAEALLWRLSVFSFATVGVLILWQQPHNRLAWFLLGVIGAIAVVPSLLEAYVLRATSGSSGTPGSLSGAALVAGLNQGTWALSVGGIGIFLVLLFPDGRLPSPRWRWLVRVGTAAITLTVLSTALIPGRITDGAGAGLVNPLGLRDFSVLVAILVGVSLGLLPVCIVAAVMAMVGRFRRSRGTERLQLKWFALAAVVAGSVLPIGLLLWDLGPLVRVAMAVALLALPVAICLAILRHRLYDIDVVIKRTLVYGSLSLSLGAIYLAVVLALQSLTGTFTGDSDLAVATSTLVVAALFQPLRRRIQTVVDRRFYRRAYDATLTLDAFTDRLSQEVDLEAVAADLRLVVDEVMSPTQLSLWLRTPGATS